MSELAGSLVLVASAGLLVRSLSQQMSAKLGFDAVHGATFEVSLPPIRYPERAFDTGMEHPAAVRFLGAALDNIRALPGVSAAGIGKPLPLSGEQQASVFTPEGELPSLPPDALSPIAQFTVASQGMIRALGATMLAGRDFSEADRADGVPVVIVNQSMAAWLWPGKDAIGRRIHVGGPHDPRRFPWMTVIGVVENMKRYALTETPRPEMMVPYTQNPYLTFGTMQFVVRSNLQTSALMPSIQRAIAAVDPTIPIAHARTIDDLVATSASNARFVTRFMESFGMVALLLTIVGVYGVIGYSVQQRRQEFAVRRALGAGTHEILRLVLGEGLNLAAVGVAVGLSLTVAAGLGLRHLLVRGVAVRSGDGAGVDRRDCGSVARGQPHSCSRRRARRTPRGARESDRPSDAANYFGASLMSTSATPSGGCGSWWATARNPHFSRTRIDPTLWAATHAWSGRIGSSTRNSESARVAMPFPQCSRPIQ